MPIYEYLCKDCNNKFDALRSMSDANAPIACLSCQSNNTSRMLSVFSAQSGGKVVAGGNGHNCSDCSSGSCAGCGS